MRLAHLRSGRPPIISGPAVALLHSPTGASMICGQQLLVVPERSVSGVCRRARIHAEALGPVRPLALSEHANLTQDCPKALRGRILNGVLKRTRATRNP
jgi:hypothetical protein